MDCEDDEISALIYDELLKVDKSLAELFNYKYIGVRYFYFLYHLLYKLYSYVYVTVKV